MLKAFRELHTWLSSCKIDPRNIEVTIQCKDPETLMEVKYYLNNEFQYLTLNGKRIEFDGFQVLGIKGRIT